MVDGPLLDFHAVTAAAGVPVEVFTVPMAGATAPVTLAGTIVQGVAEFLGVATAMQVLSPGARLIMGASGSVMDMQACSISYAAPENGLMNAACIEVAHHLGVPAIVPGLATDAKHSGVQAGYEKALKGLTTAAAQTDLMSGGVGMIDSVNTLFLPQIVVDTEIVHRFRTLLGEVEITREAMLLDMIERVGIGGNFLREKETRAASARANTSGRWCRRASPTTPGRRMGATRSPWRANAPRPCSTRTPGARRRWTTDSVHVWRRCAGRRSDGAGGRASARPRRVRRRPRSRAALC